MLYAAYRINGYRGDALCVRNGAVLTVLVKVLLAVEMRVPQENSTVFQIRHIRLTW